MTQAIEPGALAETDDHLVNAYFDDELAPDARLAFDTRLAAEPGLRVALGRLQALRVAVQSGLPKTTASDAFRARIAGIGQQLPVETRKHRAALFDWRMIAATALLSCGLGSIATYTVTSMSPAWVASPEIVAVHQHALLATDAIEVASSDRHTVKPWFDTHLALSPPVTDMVAEGFPLLGGRIDVVNGRRVPVLLYRHRAHLVSVILVPEAGSRDNGQAAILTSRDGYSVVTWRGNDFIFSAVADIADGELVAFVDRLRHVMGIPPG